MDKVEKTKEYLTPSGLRRDFALIVIILIVALFLWGCLGVYRFLHPAKNVLIVDSTDRVHILSLSEDALYSVSTDLGINVIAVKEGRVFVQEANCENHDCIKQGAIDAAGQTIACLPHQLTVRVEEGSSSSKMGQELSVSTQQAIRGSKPDAVSR